MDEARDELVKGIGEVCISASSLEWSLAYLTAVVRYGGNDDKFRKIARTPSWPLKEFREAVRFPESYKLPSRLKPRRYWQTRNAY